MAITVDRIFDDRFYLWKYGDVKAAVDAGIFSNGFEHFQMMGRDEGRRVSGYFDEEYYLQKYQDVARAVEEGVFRDGLQHFLQFGQYIRESRSSSRIIDQNWIFNYTQENAPEAFEKIKTDEITGVQYFVDLPIEKEHELTAERMYYGFWNDENYDLVSQLTTGPAFRDGNAFSVLPGDFDGGQPGKQIGIGPGKEPGIEGKLQTARLFQDAVPDLVLEHKSYIADGDRLIILWEINGTQTREFGSVRYQINGTPLSQILGVPPLAGPTPRKIRGINDIQFNPEGLLEERTGGPRENETTVNFIEMGVPIGFLDRVQPVPDAQIQLVQQTYSAFQQGNLPSVLNNLTDDIVWNSQYSSNVPYSGVWNGKTGVTTYLETVNRNVDLLNFTPQEFTAQGDIVIVRGFEQGRVKSTGREYRNNWVHVWDLNGLKVEEITTYNDTAAVAAAF